MRYQRTTVLAGIAALALLAGGSFASAQQTQNPPAGQPQANQNTPAAGGQGAQQQTGQTAQKQKSGPAAAHKRTAQMRRHSPHAMARMSRGRRTATAQHGRIPHQRTAATQQPRGMRGLQGNAQGNAPGMQGNASGVNMRLSDQQRGQIRSTVINAPNAPRVQSVPFNVAAGTVIPRGSVRVVPVTPMLARIDPRWRGFRYFVWNDNVVIVNPRTMRIVAVVPA
jgi:hypothetical protein